MRLTPQFESTLRRYVLGELEEGLRAELEELLITDTEAFEALGVIEDELIEEYLEGTGSAAQRQTFEQNFLTSPERSRHLRLARGLKERAARQEHLDAPAARHTPGLFAATGWRQLAIGLAATLIVSLTGNVWLASRHREQLASLTSVDVPAAALVLPSQTVPTTARIEDLEAELARERSERSRAEARVGALEKELKRPGSAVLTFALAGGLLRAGGSLPRVTVPPEAVVVRLLLELSGDGYPLYRAALHDADGAEVWAASKLRAEPGQAAVVVAVPSSYLSRGDYQLKLNGVSSGEQEPVETYAFRVIAP